MIQVLPFAERVDKTAVHLQIPIIAFYGVVEVCLDLEEYSKIGIQGVECMVSIMVSGKYHLHVQRYRLRCQALCTAGPQPLRDFFNGNIPVQEKPFRPLIRKSISQRFFSS